MRQNLKVYSGNRIIIEFDGKAVGLIQSCRASDSYGLERASGVGDIHAIEYVPSAADHTLSITQMVLFKGALRESGIAPENGDAVLNGNVFDVVMYSKDTGDALMKYHSCSYDSGTVNVDAHRILVSDAQLKALDRQGTRL